jgi:hypothetical protein
MKNNFVEISQAANARAAGLKYLLMTLVNEQARLAAIKTQFNSKEVE